IYHVTLLVLIIFILFIDARYVCLNGDAFGKYKYLEQSSSSFLSELLQTVALRVKIASAALSKKRNSRNILGRVSVSTKKDSTPCCLCF
ncbi:hypothetical protein KSS87_016339, partial [Heliosperma pusillum]